MGNFWILKHRPNHHYNSHRSRNFILNNIVIPLGIRIRIRWRFPSKISNSTAPFPHWPHWKIVCQRICRDAEVVRSFARLLKNLFVYAKTIAWRKLSVGKFHVNLFVDNFRPMRITTRRIGACMWREFRRLISLAGFRICINYVWAAHAIKNNWKYLAASSGIVVRQRHFIENLSIHSWNCLSDLLWQRGNGQFFFAIEWRQSRFF